MVSIDGLAVEFGGSTLFSDISFVINEKDRIALMGKNGAGKSTLLKILAGVRKPTRGSVSAPKDTVIAYLPQHLMTEDGRTVFEEASQAFAHLHQMEAEIEELNKQLAERTDYESDEYKSRVSNFKELTFPNVSNANLRKEVFEKFGAKSSKLPAHFTIKSPFEADDIMIRLKIRELLERHGKTRYWLFKQTGMSWQNVNKMANNENLKPSLGTKVKRNFTVGKFFTYFWVLEIIFI